MLRKLLNRLVPSNRAPETGAAAFAQDAADQLIARGNRAETEGNLHEACEQYRKAVAAAPGYARAQLNLGTGLEAIGDADGAILSYEAALAIDPANAYASYNLGRLFYTRGALARAGELLRSALEHKPAFPEGLVALANVYDAQGNLAAAAASLEAALVQRPDWTGALLNYAGVLRKLGRLTEAEVTVRRVVDVEPGNADASHDLASLLLARGELKEAERLLRLALALRPEFPDAYGTLFHVYEAQGKLDAAASALEAALAQRPEWPAALHNYGTVLKRLRRLPEAETVLRRAIQIAPERPEPHRALGTVLVGQARIDEALAAFRVGRELDPDIADPESGEMYALNLSADISSDELFMRHKAFAALLEKAHPPRFAPFRNAPEAARRLRIGYVSADFNRHPVALFLIPLLERHVRSAVEVYCYSVGTLVDAATQLVQARTDTWRAAALMSDRDLADAINRDGIDILVDLSGYTTGSRLAVFAQQPAPVQVSWLGYPTTTGLTRIQYRLSDRYADPPGLSDHLHTETLLRLPGSQWCYRPFPDVDYSSSETPPFRNNGYITFGSFNDPRKVSPLMRRLWAEILMRLPGSRLVIARAPEGSARESLLRDLGGGRIHPGRISFAPPVPIDEYFRRFNSVDIALDPTPYSGCTTTCDTLWMGVPVITLSGPRAASRTSASILSTVGLSEWIASTPEDYVKLAVRCAGEGAVLSEMRETLRQRMRESPLMDEVSFAQGIEDAYRQMWRAWCSGAVHQG